jgi:2Fe-2S ferredoxin
MPSVTYKDHDGTARTVQVPSGNSVMQGAAQNSIEGIVAECGGGLACATCHCYVDAAWVERVGPPSEAEDQMLDSAASERRPSSRLSCQITMSEALDGLVVHLPDKQY